MICEVWFYNLPFDKASGIRIPAGVELTAIGNNVVGTQKRTKLVLNIPSNFDRVASFYADVPTDDYPINCNYAVAIPTAATGRTSAQFWVTRPESVATDKGVLRLYFERDVVHDIKGKVKGIFSALPMVTEPVQRASTPSTLYQSSRIELPCLKSPSGKKVYWIEIISTKDFMTDYQYPIGIQTYGMFIDETYKGCYVEDNTGYTTYRCLDLSDLIGNLTYGLQNTHVSSEDILDIKISERCPYKTTVTDYSGGVKCVFAESDQQFTNYGTSTQKPFSLIPFTGLSPQIDTVDITASDNEKVYGSTNIYDASNNLIGNISMDRNWSFKCQTISDFSGIYTVLYDEKTRTKFIIQEGHLPYVGNSWENYKALSLQYDREMMSINQNRANAEAANNVGTGIANGVITGALLSSTGPLGAAAGIATAGVSVASTFIGRHITIDAEKATQKAKEEYQRIQPGNAYNLGYGTSYIDLSKKFGGAYIAVMMPKEVSVDFIEKYVKLYGYPAVGIHSVTLSKGYYQGFVIAYDNNADIDKLVLSILNDELSRGIRLIESRNDI